MSLMQVDDTQFGFMPGRGTTDAFFYSEKYAKKIQEER